jgi:hypothetical protein
MDFKLLAILDHLPSILDFHDEPFSAQPAAAQKGSEPRRARMDPSTLLPSTGSGPEFIEGRTG